MGVQELLNRFRGVTFHEMVNRASEGR